jgi:CIC family chloride channel protein
MWRRVPTSLTYLERWFLFGVLIGGVSGLGATAFYLLLNSIMRIFLTSFLRYSPPLAGGEGSVVMPDLSSVRLWLIPIIVSFGGLVSGLIVYTFAPEAEGHGTDSVIESFHRRGGRIRKRIPLVKMIASSITIGTGGSAGREGPIAQIGAGFGSWLASTLKLSDHDRRCMMVCGAAAGIGSIFKAPLGASLFSIEVLYKRDFEVDALIPAFISSVVSYSIFASITGFAPVFGAVEYEFTHPLELIFFILLGLVCALCSILYVSLFYHLRDLFKKLPIPNHFKPALGGLMLGLIATTLPQTLEMGYGWIQLAMYGQLTLTFMAIMVFAKMVATSLTIGSGGSGGVFAPSLVIGGMIGGVFGLIFNLVSPNVVNQPAAYVLVGMAAFFSGAAKVPIAAMIMVAEMTRNYNFLIPAMFACAISYIASGRWTIYEKQVEMRVDSPAHLGEYSIDLLEEIKVKDIMARRVVTVKPSTKILEVNDLMSNYLHLGYPVIEGNNLVGIITYRDILKVPLEKMDIATVDSTMSKNLVVIYPEDTAAEALRRLYINKLEQLPVVDPQNKLRLVGIVTHSDLIHGHEAAKLGISRRRVTSVLDRVRAEEVMRRDIVLVDADEPITKLVEIASRHTYQGYPVLENGRLVGMVTLKELFQALRQGGMDKKIGDILSKGFAVAYPKETVSDILKKMYQKKVGRLPVVDEDKPWKVVGLITKTDILRALELEESVDLINP